MRGSVLIADDEPLARRTLHEHLRGLGWTGPIHEARDGESAIALANEYRPELLFLDIVMPGSTGLEVLEQLRYEPKVIFTTAHDQYAVTAFELGALDYLVKPFGRDRLERVLTSDPGMGVLRHADAGYSRAIDFAAKHKIDIPMQPMPRD